MSAKKKSPIPAEKVALYEKLLATIPEIEEETLSIRAAAAALLKLER